MKRTRNNLFYKKILISPKGLSTSLPDMVLHRYVLIQNINCIQDCFVSQVERA